jgi:ribosomal protein S12 methylthiotransferase accessory factor
VLNTQDACAPASAPIFLRGEALRGTKRFLGGTHRAVPPAETFERILPHLRTAGITRLANVTGLDRIGIPTALAHRPNSPTLSSSSGKGFTLAAALVSAAMEGIELYHAENPRLPVRRATYAELEEQGEAIPRDQLLLGKESRFGVARTERWVEAWDILSGRPMLVPFTQVAMVGGAEPGVVPWMPFQMGSNGLASGNLLLEALCAGLLEVIERDAHSCHMVARHRLHHDYPKVDTAAAPFPMVRELLDKLRSAHVGAVVYDMSVDTDVPVYNAVIYDRLHRHVGMYGGYGAHLDPEIALIRALTEAVQGRLIYIAGSRDDYFRHDLLRHRMHDGSGEVAAMEAQPAEVGLGGRSSEATPTFEGDVSLLLQKLRRIGIRHVLVADLTHEELGIPVVRVIVPGLEGCALLQNYAPGPRATAFRPARAKIREA